METYIGILWCSLACFGLIYWRVTWWYLLCALRWWYWCRKHHIWLMHAKAITIRRTLFSIMAPMIAIYSKPCATKCENSHQLSHSWVKCYKSQRSVVLFAGGQACKSEINAYISSRCMQNNIILLICSKPFFNIRNIL